MSERLFLAPMAGITDMAFRLVCKSFGADIVCTEMVSSRGIYYSDAKTNQLLKLLSEEKPAGIQLFGCEPEIMAYAVKKAEEYSPSFIDINMGCPMPKIVNNGDGSALMKTPLLAARIVEAAAKATSLPVTVKIRSGFTADTINAPEFAKMLEESGASAITVHPRTRDQLYSGKADHSVTAAVRQSVKIPVIANGDIFTPEDAAEVIKKTGCSDIMIARGSLGNPFIFAEIKDFFNKGSFTLPTAEEKLGTAAEHLRLMCGFKPERQAVPEIRKQMAWYLKGLPGGAKLKTKIFEAKTRDEIELLLAGYILKKGNE